MSDLLDLFVKEPEGVRWFDTAASMDDARKKIAQHGQAEYVIYDSKTGEQIVLRIVSLPAHKRPESSEFSA